MYSGFGKEGGGEGTLSRLGGGVWKTLVGGGEALKEALEESSGAVGMLAFSSQLRTPSISIRRGQASSLFNQIFNEISC